MKPKPHVIFLLLVAASLGACKKDPKPTPAPTQPTVEQKPTGAGTTPAYLAEYGLGTTLYSEHSNARPYDFYIDQSLTGQYSGINCGPAVTTMALKWADETFALTAEQARNTIRAGGGWWYTSDITQYLSSFGMNSRIVAFDGTPATLKAFIDNDYTVILCLDMFYAAQNTRPTERTNKFYVTQDIGWGHFLLVKGYKQVDSKFYYEIYDPYSYGKKYADGTLFGKNRYYESGEIKKATDAWWKYAIIVAPKGKTVTTATRTFGVTEVPVAWGR